MGIKSFILNGGILGAIRGYDSEKEGRPYGFGELNEDLDQVNECCGKLVSTSKNVIVHATTGMLDVLDDTTSIDRR